MFANTYKMLIFQFLTPTSNNFLMLSVKLSLKLSNTISHKCYHNSVRYTKDPIRCVIHQNILTISVQIEQHTSNKLMNIHIFQDTSNKSIVISQWIPLTPMLITLILLGYTILKPNSVIIRLFLTLAKNANTYISTSSIHI
jgi:hypothetical protein